MAIKKPKGPLAPLDVAQRYSLGEACAYLRVSVPTLYNEINAGRIRTIRHGSRRYVPGSEIARVSA
jgi:excisionase family DNA binding protein